jgi:hypothetical protein
MHSGGKLHFKLNCKFQSSIPFGANSSHTVFKEIFERFIEWDEARELNLMTC